MRFCSNCGAKLTEGAKFCTECGTRVPAAETIPIATGTAPVSYIPEEPPVVTPPPAPPQPVSVPSDSEKTPVPPPAAPDPVPDKVKAPKKKKLSPILFLVIALVIAAGVACVFLFGGNKALEPYAGKYEAAFFTYNGTSEAVEDQWLQLNSNGKGTLRVLGAEYPIVWTLDAGAIRVEQNGVTYSGTLIDGIISLDLSGRVYVFHASGIPAPALPKPTETLPPETEPQETTEPPTTEPAVTFSPCTYSGSNYSFTVIGAEAFQDYEGAYGIRVYYDYTNLSSEKSTAFYCFNISASQDDKDAEFTYVSFEDDVPEYGNDSLYVLPGHTIRCIAEFLANPEGGIFEVTFEDSDTYSTLLTVEIDPTYLPGRPEEEVMNQPDPNADWRDGYAYEGYFDDLLYFSFDEAEITEAPEGNQMIRIFFTARNISEYHLELWRFATLRAYQDGIELPRGDAAEITDTDTNYTELDNPEVYIQAGDTVRMSACFPISTMSPVLIEFINDFDDSDGFAAVYLLS